MPPVGRISITPDDVPKHEMPDKVALISRTDDCVMTAKVAVVVHPPMLETVTA